MISSKESAWKIIERNALNTWHSNQGGRGETGKKLIQKYFQGQLFPKEGSDITVWVASKKPTHLKIQEKYPEHS